MRHSRYVLTTSNPFAFTGKVVEKHGPNRYLVRQGTVTTCELPRPKWRFSGGRMVVDVDGTAKIYNSDFRLMGVPVATMIGRPLEDVVPPAYCGNVVVVLVVPVTVVVVTPACVVVVVVLTVVVVVVTPLSVVVVPPAAVVVVVLVVVVVVVVGAPPPPVMGP